MLNKKLTLIVFSLLVIVVIFLSGCTQRQVQKEGTQTPLPQKVKEGTQTLPPQEVNEGKKTFTIEEVSMHNTKSDCWFVIHDKVYDVTSFISSHPGGKAILQGCGKDATELYETRPMGSGTPHSDNARNRLNDFYIGDLSS